MSEFAVCRDEIELQVSAEYVSKVSACLELVSWLL